MTTERLRLGPMVTPLSRRRPTKVARETATLDVLSNGRLTLGVGIGGDRFGGEYTALGEPGDDRTHAAMLDESLAILQAAWSGERVELHGAHYTVDGATFLPRPVQRPGIPVWVGGFPGTRRPPRRLRAREPRAPGPAGRRGFLHRWPTAPRARSTWRWSWPRASTWPPTRPPAPPGGSPPSTPETVTADVVPGVLRDGPIA